MAKTRRKRSAKPKTDKQKLDGLDMSFEQAMTFLAQAPDKDKEPPQKPK
jgi:hypothetical protein